MGSDEDGVVGSSGVVRTDFWNGNEIPFRRFNVSL